MKTNAQHETATLITDLRAGVTPVLYCPKCGRGNLHEVTVGWVCMWRDCGFKINEIPSTETVLRLLQLRNDLNLLEQYHI